MFTTKKMTKIIAYTRYWGSSVKHRDMTVAYLKIGKSPHTFHQLFSFLNYFCLFSVGSGGQDKWMSHKCHGKSRHYDYIKNWEELSNWARERRIKACDDMTCQFPYGQTWADDLEMHLWLTVIRLCRIVMLNNFFSCFYSILFFYCRLF